MSLVKLSKVYVELKPCFCNLLVQIAERKWSGSSFGQTSFTTGVGPGKGSAVTAAVEGVGGCGPSVTSTLWADVVASLGTVPVSATRDTVVDSIGGCVEGRGSSVASSLWADVVASSGPIIASATGVDVLRGLVTYASTVAEFENSPSADWRMTAIVASRYVKGLVDKPMLAMNKTRE